MKTASYNDVQPILEKVFSTYPEGMTREEVIKRFESESCLHLHESSLKKYNLEDITQARDVRYFVTKQTHDLNNPWPDAENLYELYKKAPKTNLGRGLLSRLLMAFTLETKN